MTETGILILAVIGLSMVSIVSITTTIAVCRKYKKDMEDISEKTKSEEWNGKEVSG